MSKMRHLLIKTMAVTGLLLSGLAMSASGQYPPPGEDRYQERREGRDFDRFFDRIRVDLDRASAFSLPFTGERSRIARAREEVNECQRAAMAGDRRPFDEAIGAIQRVVDLNRLSDRSRDNLIDDVQELREMESRLQQ